jgi:3-oxoacyl-[acyl-carrier-protein] synthase-3
MKDADEQRMRIRDVVERCLKSAIEEGTRLPLDDDDWIESGLLDSMAHVEVLLCMERAVGSPNLFTQGGRVPPTTIRSAIEAIEKSSPPQGASAMQEVDSQRLNAIGSAGLVGWGSAFGSQRLMTAQVEREFSMPVGDLAKRAGLDGICRASHDEDEISLGKTAADKALESAGVYPQSLNWVIGTSETLLGFPSFAALLHSVLLASPTCRVLDVGGACLGLLNALVVADALFADRRVDNILVVSADVHSRLLVPGKVPGEFGGLFGDGASAFVLQRFHEVVEPVGYSIRTSIGSCIGTFSSALQVRPSIVDGIALTFDGEALAHSAVDRMERIISDLETASGVRREAAIGFALHQPNPRLTKILLQRARLPLEKVPLIAGLYGNLGSSTCGVALSALMDLHAKKPSSQRGPIFLAAVGPGLLWAGAVLV